MLNDAVVQYFTYIILNFRCNPLLTIIIKLRTRIFLHVVL